MAGPTDLLTEDVKDLREANRQLAAEIKGVFDRLSVDLRDQNQRLADAINGVARDLGNFRVEVTKELGEIKTTLEKYQSDTATSLRFAGRSVVILIPVVISMVAAAIGIAWHAGRLDWRVQQVEKGLDAGGSPRQPPEKGPATVLIPKGSPAASERVR